jgi:hypothetical protein
MDLNEYSSRTAKRLDFGFPDGPERDCLLEEQACSGPAFRRIVGHRVQ